MSKHNLLLTINPASRRKACFPGNCMRRTAAMNIAFRRDGGYHSLNQPFSGINTSIDIEKQREWSGEMI